MFKVASLRNYRFKELMFKVARWTMRLPTLENKRTLFTIQNTKGRLSAQEQFYVKSKNT